jgi:catalase
VGGPHANPARAAEVRWAADGQMVRAAQTLRPDDGDWSQAGTLVREVMDDTQRERLAHNVVLHVSDGVKEPVLSRVFEYWRNIDPEIGQRIEEGVRANRSP